MYYYQILEGIFHCLIVMGGIQYILYDINIIFYIGILLEFLMMDTIYFVCFTYIHFKAPKNIKNISKYSTIIHHMTIIPNILYLYS